jgi:hypothetical protein
MEEEKKGDRGDKGGGRQGRGDRKTGDRETGDRGDKGSVRIFATSMQIK